MRQSGPPRCCADTFRSITTSRFATGRSAVPSNAWGSAGSGPATNWPCAPRRGVNQKGLKRGLKGRTRTVLLMLDETIVTETPPLYCCYGHIGEQVEVPITGNRAKRVLHGAINIKSGDLALLITEEWIKETHQTFLAMIRSHWRGWNLVLFEDRASQHTSPESLACADELGIEVRLLPKAAPELNTMDHLWRHS